MLPCPSGGDHFHGPRSAGHFVPGFPAASAGHVGHLNSPMPTLRLGESTDTLVATGGGSQVFGSPVTPKMTFPVSSPRGDPADDSNPMMDEKANYSTYRSMYPEAVFTIEYGEGWNFCLQNAAKNFNPKTHQVLDAFDEVYQFVSARGDLDHQPAPSDFPLRVVTRQSNNTTAAPSPAKAAPPKALAPSVPAPSNAEAKATASLPPLKSPPPEQPTPKQTIPTPDQTIPKHTSPTPNQVTPKHTSPTPEQTIPKHTSPTPEQTSPTPDQTIPKHTSPTPDQTIPKQTSPAPAKATPAKASSATEGQPHPKQTTSEQPPVPEQATPKQTSSPPQQLIPKQIAHKPPPVQQTASSPPEERVSMYEDGSYWRTLSIQNL